MMSAVIDTNGDRELEDVHDARQFGRAVRRARRERGWTQADLAAWLGASRQTVIKLEAGGAVSLPFAMAALAMLGRKAVIARKGLRIGGFSVGGS